MAAAAPDHSLGFFSAVFSRLRAASSAWRRKRSNDADARETQLGKEATVRSRLARRAGAVRRFGRNLAFVSFNLEVLLFVYAFWRSRRRNLNWRQPLQALPMLVIPALATLIYAVFVRFTRTLDLKDKKTLQRLEQQHHSVQRGSGSHQNQQNSVEKCDPVDDAINFSSETDPAPAETSKLGKHHRPSINLRDDGGGDDCWGHSKDFQPIRSNGLRRRTFTIEKTHITNSSAFRQLSNWPTEHLSDDPGDPNHMEGTAEHHSNSGADVAENGVACSTAQINSSLPGCSAAHIISNATDHADLSSSMSCPKSSRGLAEEDAVQTALTGPKSGLPDVAELHHEGVENEPSKFHVSEDSRMPFISEEELLVSSNAVENIEHHSGTSGFTLCSQEMEKEDVAGGLFYIKVSPVLSLLSSPELVVEGGKDASEKESCELDQKEENNVAVNSEDEALLGKPVVNTAELDNGTSGFSLRAQDSNMMEVPAIVNISSVIPESNYPTSAELPAEDGEDCKDAGTSDVHLPEQNGQEELSDPLVVDSFEDLFATSEFLSRTVVAEMTEVLDAVQEGLSEGASDHQNAVVASSDDGGDTENAISNSVFVQLIPEANIMEALQDVENEEPLASKGGDYGSKDVNFALLDTSISLNEFTNAKSWTDNAGCSPCITESNRTESLHDGKQALPKTSESANLGLEESLISLDQEINLEIFSLYSRSSSCVSEVNMTETLRSATFPALENDNDFSFDETTSMMVANVSHAENCTNNARSAEFIPEIDMTETLYVGKEAPSRLEHEVYSNSDISLKAPDVANVVEKFDNSLDLLLWSFDPVVDASEGLQADQGFSKLQPENDTTFVNVETNVTTKEVNSDGVYATNIFGDLQNRKETSIDASGSAKVSKSHSQIVSPEAQPQDPLIFKDSLFLLSAEVKLIESLEGDQGETDQQQDETNVVSEDMYMVCQGSISEKRPNNLGCQHISDANTTKTLQGTERLPSGIFHDGIFGIAGTSVSLDGGNDTDNSSADSGSEMHTAQNNTVVLLGLPKPETAMVSISRCEVDGAEKNGSDSICDEAAMTGAIQGVNKSPSQSQDELPGTYVSTDRANHPEYSRPSSSVPDDNSIELLAAGQERPLDRKYEIPSSFQKTSPSENLSNNLVCASHTSKSVTFSVKEFPGPSLEDVDGFDMVSTDEQANKSIKENALSCEQIARTRAEVNCNESQDFTEASKLNCTEASESVSEVFFDPEHHGPEVVLSQVGMPFFIDEGEETEKNLGSSSTACASSYHDISILETLRVLPVSAGSEKGFLEGSKVCEWHCTDKDPKDLKVEDLKDNVEDLNEDHEDSP